MNLDFEQLLSQCTEEARDKKIIDISSDDFFRELTKAIAEGVAQGITQVEIEKKT